MTVTDKTEAVAALRENVLAAQREFHRAWRVLEHWRGSGSAESLPDIEPLLAASFVQARDEFERVLAAFSREVIHGE